MSSIATASEAGVAPTGFRLPAETRLGAVRLQVSDLDQSVAFYEGVIGLRVQSRTSERAVLVAGADSAPRPANVTTEEAAAPPLVVLETRPGVHAVPRRATLGLYHFAILVPDRATLGRFVAHLTPGGLHVGMSDHLVSEAVYLTDPDGLGIEVYADRPRESWRYDGRQLVMATNPLDVRRLLGAAAGEPWQGMPNGTVIGHVHLHVGDLVAAERFYHSALGFDKTVWEYPGALFLSAGGYHHHLGANTWASGPIASDRQARLLSWDLVVPHASLADAARSLTGAGYAVSARPDGWAATDPWGTTLHLVAAA
jgi:catechol 2,3-dioxygenase